MTNERDVSRRMSGQMPYVEAKVAELHATALGKFMISRWRVLNLDAPLRGVTGGVHVENLVSGMDPNRYGSRRDHASDSTHMIEMRVRQPNAIEAATHRIDRSEQRLGLVAWINEDGLSTDGVGDQPAVLLQRTDRQLPEREGVHGNGDSSEAGTGASAVSSTGDSPMP